METPHIVEGNDAPLSADIGDFIEIPEGMRWECAKCGSCCGNIFSQTWLDVHLSEYIGDPVNGFCKYLAMDNGGERRCKKYLTRPNICRGYPFIIRKKGDYYILTVHRKCPGVGRGAVLDIEDRLISTLKLVEDDLSVEFIIRRDGSNQFRMYKVK
jgi:Fe-S-cluster containining protein